MSTFILISAHLKNLSAARNVYRHLDLETILQKLDFKYSHVIGKYNGEVEDSFQVKLPELSSVEKMRILTKIAIEFKQESILLVSNGKAILLNTNGKMEELGKFVRVNYEQANDKGSFSFIDNEYFITIPENEVKHV